MRPGSPSAEERRSATEERLRAAFTARAALVTHRELRHAEPPRGRAWGTHRVRGLVVAGFGAAVAVAAAYLLVLSPGPVGPRVPEPPARSPGVVERPVSPTPHPAPVEPSVQPDVTSPGPVRTS
ncbi:hypothetical protein ACIQCR_24365 [Streptomyces sp. NPDC093249]|uniref:hypothetical protein n=1 Tax=unclassified Streptomyces TaxID=2593676 RepID=UPI00382F9701